MSHQKKPAPPPLTPQQQALKNLFPESGVRNSAQGALDFYNLYATPEFEQSQMFNYQLPNTGTDSYLARLYGDALRPENERSPEVLEALGMLQGQARAGASPELFNAYNEARSIALGGEGPAMTSQRDVMNRGLNSALQTALRTGKVGASAGGLRGGGQAAIARPIIREYGRNVAEGLQGIQIGNLGNYYGLAGQVDASRKGTASAYNNALGQRESFESQRYADRLGRYNTVNNQNLDRYYTLGGIDRQRRDAYMGGRIQAPFLGASVAEQRLGRKNAAKYGAAAINAAQSFSIPSFGISSGGGGGGGGSAGGGEVFQRPS